MEPNDLELATQLEFLDGALPRPPAQVLDAGCGRWRLAVALIGRGYDVTALDIEEDNVAAARDGGVAAIHGDFLEHQGGPYDAVLFSRSLHHIASLDGAVRRAHRLIRPDGLLVADEFAHERADRASAAWYYGTQAILVGAGVARPREHDHGSAAADPLDRWRDNLHHDPPLHTGQAMREAIGERFTLLRVEPGPYLFGYLGRDLEETARGYELAGHLLALERTLIAERAIAEVGLRIVARR